LSIYRFFAANLWSYKRGEQKGKFSSSSTIIATISIAVSLFVMVLAINISDGFRHEVREKAVGFTGDFILTSPGVDPLSGLYPVSSELSYLPGLNSLGEIRSFSGFAYRSGMIKNGDLIQGVVLKGVEQEYDWEFYRSALSTGTLPDYSDSTLSNQILISGRLASALKLSSGDRVRIYFIDKSVRVSSFEISGVYDAQLEEIDKTLIIADIRQIQRLNGWSEGEVSGFEIALKKGVDSRDVMRRMNNIIYSSSTVKDPPADLLTVEEMYPHLFDWLTLLDYNVMVVLILMLAVAGFNMISGLLILLFEKISVIGLFKALGMKNMDIHKIFLSKSSTILVRGMLAGNLAALTAALIQKFFRIVELDPANYFVDAVPIHIDLLKIASLNLCAYLVVMLLMFLPSLFIAGINPAGTMAVK